MVKRNPTHEVKIGKTYIGQNHPIAVQSMCSTKTQDTKSTITQINSLQKAGASIIRVAADSKKDAQALKIIRDNTDATLSVDLQENYRLAALVAPYVDKIRYNPGHLHHHEKDKIGYDKVKYIVETAEKNNCAIRVGVNAGSIDPKRKKIASISTAQHMADSALEHSHWLDNIGFNQYCVSLKDSSPDITVQANKLFSKQRPDIPLHLGVTEAGIPPTGIEKTRIAFEQLIGLGIGDTIRVSLTLPNAEKHEEVIAGMQILQDIKDGRVRSVVRFHPDKLNLISCPSCSRVENESFIQLAQEVERRTRYAEDHAITIAVMGCRVNGPGETDDADIGLWCGPNYVNLKKQGVQVGAYKYEDILGQLDIEIKNLIKQPASK